MLDGTELIEILRPCVECEGSGTGNIRKLVPPKDWKAVARYVYVCGLCDGAKYRRTMHPLRDVVREMAAITNQLEYESAERAAVFTHEDAKDE